MSLLYRYCYEKYTKNTIYSIYNASNIIFSRLLHSSNNINIESIFVTAICQIRASFEKNKEAFKDIYVDKIKIKVKTSKVSSNNCC